MQKELKEVTVKVSQSMPNLTNIYRIGREVVKSNNVVDEDIPMRDTCTILSVNTKNEVEYFITIPINYLLLLMVSKDCYVRCYIYFVYNS